MHHNAHALGTRHTRVVCNNHHNERSPCRGCLICHDVLLLALSIPSPAINISRVAVDARAPVPATFRDTACANSDERLAELELPKEY